MADLGPIYRYLQLQAEGGDVWRATVVEQFYWAA